MMNIDRQNTIIKKQNIRRGFLKMVLLIFSILHFYLIRFINSQSFTVPLLFDLNSFKKSNARTSFGRTAYGLISVVLFSEPLQAQFNSHFAVAEKESGV